MAALRCMHKRTVASCPMQEEHAPKLQVCLVWGSYHTKLSISCFTNIATTSPVDLQLDDNADAYHIVPVPTASIALAIFLMLFGMMSLVLAWMHFTQQILGKQQAVGGQLQADGKGHCMGDGRCGGMGCV